MKFNEAKSIKVEYKLSEKSSKTVRDIDWEVHHTWDNNRAIHITQNPPIEDKKADIALIMLNSIQEKIRCATLPGTKDEIENGAICKIRKYKTGVNRENFFKEARKSFPSTTAGSWKQKVTKL